MSDQIVNKVQKVRYDISWRRANLAALLGMCLLGGAAVAWLLCGGRAWLGWSDIPVDPVRVAAASQKIDPNTADVPSLRRLHPLGPIKAAAIVEYRKTRGPAAYRTLDDLANVAVGQETDSDGVVHKGRRIGRPTVDRFARHLTLSAEKSPQ